MAWWTHSQYPTAPQHVSPLFLFYSFSTLLSLSHLPDSCPDNSSHSQPFSSLYRPN